MRKSNLNGLKISMAAASLVLTLIIWNLFSSKALEDALKTAQDQNQPQIQPGNTLSDMAPLPTLVPLQFSLAVDSGAAAEPVQPVSVQPAPAAQPTQSLRKMTAPTPSAAPQKPIVHQVVIVVSGGGGGGGGGAAPAAVTSTGSSKK